MRILAIVCLILTGLSTSAYSQVAAGDNGELSARAYTDYYWMAQHHNSQLEGAHGIQFRRIYLTYDKGISDQFSARLRLEMDSEGYLDGATKMTPVVKDAYLKWKNEDHQILAGISGAPAFAKVEDYWGYRSVEKTPLDLYGLASSRDFGVALKGNLGSEKLSYHLMAGNGNSNRANEVNKGKKVMLSLGYKLSEQLFVEVYGDYDDREGDFDRTTFQGFAAFQQSGFTAGLMYAMQNRENALIGINGSEDLDLQIASVFTNFDLKEGMTALLRVDHSFDGVPGTDGDAYLPIHSNVSSTLLIAGVDLQLHKNVRFIPNIETVFYGEDDAGITPTTDVIPRLTLYYKF